MIKCVHAVYREDRQGSERRKGMQDGDGSSREEKVTRAAGCEPKPASDGGLCTGHRVKIIRDMNLRSAHSDIAMVTPFRWEKKKKKKRVVVGKSFLCILVEACFRVKQNETLKIRRVTAWLNKLIHDSLMKPTWRGRKASPNLACMLQWTSLLLQCWPLT